ncbi:hypothetical protein JNJ66_03820 [Candidatus Saccharibacteria bacterium]|nr:hypothetical protein [Candidatus Saccharibacteria bacterium]
MMFYVSLLVFPLLLALSRHKQSAAFGKFAIVTWMLGAAAIDLAGDYEYRVPVDRFVFLTLCIVLLTLVIFLAAGARKLSLKMLKQVVPRAYLVAAAQLAALFIPLCLYVAIVLGPSNLDLLLLLSVALLLGWDALRDR